MMLNRPAIFRLFAAICLLLVTACPGWGATYNIGPGQTYETFTALVAAVTLQPGDIVDGGGNTFSEIFDITDSGSSGLPITITNAKIDCSETLSYGVDINNSTYITIHDVEIFDSVWHGIYFNATSDTDALNLIISECIIHDCGQSPNTNRMGISGNGSYISVLNTSIYNTRTDAVYIKGTNITIDSCHLYNVDLEQAGGDVIQLNSLSTNYIVTNNILDASNSLRKGAFINSDTGVSNGIFSGNTVIGGGGFAFSDMSGGISVYGNTFFANGKTIENGIQAYSDGGSYCYNIISGYTRGIYARSETVSVDIYNNVIYNCGRGLDANVATGSANINFKNNIVYNENESSYYILAGAGPTITMDYNIWWPENSGGISWSGSTYDTILAFSTATGQDLNSKSSNPLFLDTDNKDFHLQASSPCIDAGTRIDGLYTDFDGKHIYGRPDIGAYERQPGIMSGVTHKKPLITPIIREVIQ